MRRESEALRAGGWDQAGLTITQEGSPEYPHNWTHRLGVLALGDMGGKELVQVRPGSPGWGNSAGCWEGPSLGLLAQAAY